MTPKQKTKASKFLSLILRHKPQIIKLTLDENGWGSVAVLLKGLKDHFPEMSLSVLKEIVAEDEKQRYSFDKPYHKIKANQGHSIEVDLDLPAIEPPEFLWHGTAKRSLSLIMRDGLLPMNRKFVHLSIAEDVARSVGKRHGSPTIILVSARNMHQDGYSFYQSDNGVWLTERVPMEYMAFEDFRDE